jgi:hypothetical protein
MNSDDIKCLRCGKCCDEHIKKDGVIVSTGKKCPYMIRLANNKTICRIYANRLGHETQPGSKCHMRTDLKFNIPGCPYNQDDWLMIEEV